METGGLALEIGSVLQLQFLTDETKTRHYVKVIGYLQDKSLIVTTPQVHNKIMMVREGQAIAVRSLTGSEVVAFNVSVIRATVKPYPYLHLTYPKDMQAITVRKAQRISCNTTAIVRKCGPEVAADETPPQAIPIAVEDMSTTGALLISEARLGGVKGLVNVEMQLHVSDINEDIHIIAIIRNVRERAADKDGKILFLHGVEFQFADRQESIMLHAFICEQIVSGNASM